MVFLWMFCLCLRGCCVDEAECCMSTWHILCWKYIVLCKKLFVFL